MNANRTGTNHWDDLLITKLRIPALSPNIIRRERLTQALQAGMDQRIITVVAPTGYGKTTLLVEWLSGVPAQSRHVVWINLDPLDNSPIQFWSYVVLGLQQCTPSFKIQRQELLPYSLQPENYRLLNPLINEIARVERPVYLVLDDTQVIQDEAIQHSLEYLIDHQPPNLHLILAGRTAPSLRLSRQQALGHLTEFSAQDLSFTYAETMAYLSRAAGGKINLDQLEQLHKATEGWVAGLQLAALSLKSWGSSVSGEKIFPDSPFDVQNYLLEEVIHLQDAATREFLLKTSLLSELSPSLCDAVLGWPASRSGEMLRQVKRANLFITCLDEERQWYRYHPLFADALRSNLHQEYPGEILALHRRAYTWLRENGFSEKAISHALTAGDAGIVADILEESALQAIVKNDLVTLVYWTQWFNDELLNQHPRLGIYVALAHFYLGRGEQGWKKIHEVGQLLDTLQKSQQPSAEIERMRWELAAVQDGIGSQNHPPSEMIPRLEALIQTAPKDDTYFTGFLFNSLAIAYRQMDETDASIAAFQRGCQFAETHGLSNGFMHSQCELARMLKITGRLFEAEQAYQLALKFAIPNEVHLGSKILALTGLMDLSLEKNDLARASQYEDEILSLLARQSDILSPGIYQILILLRLANIRLAQADLQMVRIYFQSASRFVEEIQGIFGHQLLDEFIQMQVRVWIAQGELPRCEQWLKGQIRLTTDSGRAAIVETICLARVYLAQDEPKLVCRLIPPIIPIARQKGMAEHEIEAHALLAIALAAMQKTEQAYEEIHLALSLAEPEGYVRIFVNEGERMQDLLLGTLAGLRGKPIGADQTDRLHYLVRLVKAFGGVVQRAIPTSTEVKNILASDSSLLEPLSLRESEVLTLLLAGKSIKEIAAEMAIAPNTVRAHVRTLHRKLDVHSRLGIYQRAKELKLIG